MAKFTVEEKVQYVLRYQNGNESMGEIAKGIGVHESIFSAWVRLYEHHGEGAFIKSYTTYSTKFKMDVLNYIDEMGTSYRETAAIFNLPTHTMVRRWQLAFEQGGINALETKKKGRPSLKKNTNKTETQKPKSDEETVEALQAKVERLEMEIVYLKKLNALVQMQEKLQTKSKRK